MPAAQQAYYNFAAGPIGPVTTAETVVGTTRGVSSSYPGCVFAIEVAFDLLTAASSSGYVVRIRRDSLTGSAVFTGPTIAVAASTQVARAHAQTTDSPAGEVTSAVYVVTVAVAGSAANPSVTNIFTKVTVAE